MPIREKDNYHYFASSGIGWNTGSDIRKVLEIRRQEDHLIASGFQVWEVPGKDKDSDYKIEWYAPQVEGAKSIIVEEYDWSRSKKR